MLSSLQSGVGALVTEAVRYIRDERNMLPEAQDSWNVCSMDLLMGTTIL
jgi:hypothetical protein